MKRSPIQRKTPLRASQVRMKSRHSTGKPTTAEAQRIYALAHSRCLACTMNKTALGNQLWIAPFEGSDVHHLLSGGTRRGHSDTVALCPWHHRGVAPNGLSVANATAFYGPSLARNPRGFHEFYGTDADLLALQNRMLRENA